jgi:hypothetical protein
VKKSILFLLFTVFSAMPSRAEIRTIDITIFGMD